MSSAATDVAEVEVLDPELREFEDDEEVPAPREEALDPEVETPPPLLLVTREDMEGFAAIGAETLLVWLELGRGSAMVTG